MDGAPFGRVSPITDPKVFDRILAHRERAGLESPLDARATPAV